MERVPALAPMVAPRHRRGWPPLLALLLALLLVLPTAAISPAGRALQPVPSAGVSLFSLPPLLQARVDHSLVELLNGTVAVIGGNDGVGVLDSVELLAPDASAWVGGPQLPQAAARSAATVLPNGTLVVLGGSAANGSATDAVIALVPGAWAWQSWPSLPENRTGAVATTLDNGSVALVGGVGGTTAAPQPLLTPILMGEPATGQWSAVGGTTVPGAGGAVAAVVAQDQDGSLLPDHAGVVILGGTRGSAPFGVPTAVGVRVHPDALPQETLSMPAPRSGGVAVGLPNVVALVGGDDGTGPTDSVWSLPLDGGAWKVLPPLPQARRGMLGAILDHSHLLVAGGQDAQGNVVASGSLIDVLNSTVVAGPALPQAQAAAAQLLLANASTLLVGGVGLGALPTASVVLVEPSWHLPMVQVALTPLLLPIGAGATQQVQVEVTDGAGEPLPAAQVVAFFGAASDNGTTDPAGALILELMAPQLMGGTSEWVDLQVIVTSAGLRPAHLVLPLEVLPMVPPQAVPPPPPWTEARFLGVATEDTGLQGNRTERWTHSDVVDLPVGNGSCDAHLFNISSDEARLTVNHNSDPVETSVHTDQVETACPQQGTVPLRQRWQQVTIVTHGAGGDTTNTATLTESHEGWPSLNPVNLSMSGGLTELSTTATEHLLRQRTADGVLTEDTERWQWANDSVTIFGVEGLQHWLGERTVYHLTRSLDGITTEHWWYDPQLQLPLRRTIQEQDGTVLWEFSLVQLDDQVAPPPGSNGEPVVIQAVGTLPSLYEGTETPLRLQVRLADSPSQVVSDLLLNITVSAGLSITPTPARTNVTGVVGLTLGADSPPGAGPFFVHVSVIPLQGYSGNLTLSVEVLIDSVPPQVGAPQIDAAREGVALHASIGASDAQTAVASVYLYHRVADDGSDFVRERMGSPDLLTYTGTIAADEVRPPALEVYFEATDDAGNVATLPPAGAAGPLLVSVTPAVTIPPECTLTSAAGHVVRTSVSFLGAGSTTCRLLDADDPLDPHATGLRWNITAIGTVLTVALSVAVSAGALPSGSAVDDLRLARRTAAGTWEELDTTLVPPNQLQANATTVGTFALRWHTAQVITPPDVTAPVVSVRSHTTDGRVVAGPVLFYGVVTDDVGVTQLWVRLDGASWQPVPPLTNWSVVLSLVAGPHAIEFRATDAAGNPATAALNLTALPAGGGQVGGTPSTIVLLLIGVVAVLAVAVVATLLPRSVAKPSRRVGRARHDDSEE